MNPAAPSQSLKPTPRKAAMRFPAVPFYGVMALLAVAVSATVFGTTTGVGTVKNVLGQPVAMRDITITKLADDTVEVRDAYLGTVIQSYPAGEGGFVRGSIRAFARVRMADDPENSQPYRLIRWDTNAVTLSDTISGARYTLNAFGPDNAAAFAALLDADANNKTTAENAAIQSEVKP